MTNAISMWVPGTAVPQGSKVAFRYQPKGETKGRLGVREVAGDALVQWRRSVVDRALTARGQRSDWRSDRNLEEAYKVSLDFYIRRPKGHFLPTNSKRSAPELKPGALTYPIGTPDIDKLTRAVLDGLTSAGIWFDDSQVIEVSATKTFSDGLLGKVSDPGCFITVTKLLDV